MQLSCQFGLKHMHPILPPTRNRYQSMLPALGQTYPFRPEDSAQTDCIGLVLTLAARAVARHQGHIRAQQGRPGAGATFSITLGTEPG